MRMRTSTLVLGTLAVAVLALAFRDDLGAMIPGYRPDMLVDPKPVKSSKPRDSQAMKPLPTVVRLDHAPSSALGGAINPNKIDVLDSETLLVDGKAYRLVGVSTPATGELAKCAVERQLAESVTKRLREIVAGGGLQFQRVSCACEAGTEGTERCNGRRFCGVLTSGGRDVGLILIGEGLARRYDCAATSCPAKGSWC